MRERDVFPMIGGTRSPSVRRPSAKMMHDFVTALSLQGIRLTAIHNHWLHDQPRLIMQPVVMDPLRFARSLAPVLKRLHP